MTITKYKVLAYITHGNRLLVFKHPHAPEAGIQIPGGTLEEGETPQKGVLREAYEETGLGNLKINHFLGETLVSLAPIGRDEINHRYFYHLLCSDQPPETWQHYEMYPSEGSKSSHLFEFFWVDLPNGLPKLVGEQDQMLPQLLKVLGL